MLGIASVLFLPDRPESTTFLNERERKLAIERMNRSTSGDHGAVIQKGNTERSQNYLHIDFSFQTMFMPLSVIGGCVCCLFSLGIMMFLHDILFEQIYMGGVIYIGLNNALSAISAFLPTIITTFGFSTSLPKNFHTKI